MLKRTVLALFCLVLVLTLALPTPGQASAADPFAQALAERMPGWLDKYHVPGAVIASIQNGEVAWVQAYGLADRSTGAPMTAEMIFNFGSCGKVLTAWGVMRLVEQGKVDLDAPVNDYLKRWQLHSDEFDAQQVTVRRLLSHTAGLTVHGFTDYSPRRGLPTLVEMLEGKNQTDGAVTLFQQPGKGFQYSGGGYVLLQMVIEDVSGEPFADFMQREVTGPLGLPSLQWAWTPELAAAAPLPYDQQQAPLEYRQLASPAIGSEISTTADFARFVAAAVEGPRGEPVGRGVLLPDSLREMTRVQSGTQDSGLAYGVTPLPKGVLLQHFGSNSGWNAFFSLDTGRREGVVMATNSSNGFPINVAVQEMWLDLLHGGSGVLPEPAPESSEFPPQNMLALALAGLLILALLVVASVFVLDLRLARRVRAPRPRWRSLLAALLWGAAAAFWFYWFYTSLPLFFSTGFPDLWHTRQVDLVTGALLGWVGFNLVAAWFPRKSIDLPA